MQYKKGDILACWDNSLLSRVIRYIDKSSVSHIAVMYDDEMVIESAWNGVRIVRLEDIQKRSNFYILRYMSINDFLLESVTDYFQHSYGSKYDYMQLFTIGLHKILKLNIADSHKKYICSELAWEAYNSIGVDIVPQLDEHEKVTPKDLLNSKVLYVVGLYLKK